jgi:hypothetical protein
MLAAGACRNAPPSTPVQAVIGQQESVTVSAKPDSEPEPRFGSIREAVEFIQTKVDVPVVLPSPLPPRTRLQSDPVYRFGIGRHGWALQLAFGPGDGRAMLLQYGLGAFDGCGGDTAEPVDILGQRGLIDGERGGYPWTTLIWPVAEGTLEGRYGIHGGFSKSQAITMAESMERARVEASHEPPMGC